MGGQTALGESAGAESAFLKVAGLQRDVLAVHHVLRDAAGALRDACGSSAGLWGMCALSFGGVEGPLVQHTYRRHQASGHQAVDIAAAVRLLYRRAVRQAARSTGAPSRKARWTPKPMPRQNTCVGPDVSGAPLLPPPSTRDTTPFTCDNSCCVDCMTDGRVASTALIFQVVLVWVEL